MFKKKIIYLVAVLVVLALYLYLANAFIYYRIGQGNLISPMRQDYYSMASQPNGKEIKYVAIGDSLTCGVGAENYEQSYPYLLAQDMSAAGLNIIVKNFSQPGAKTKDLIDNFLNPAIAEYPDIVTVFIGVNDIHNHINEEEFTENYGYILDRLTKETQAKVNVINIPLIGSRTVLFPPYDYYFSQKTDEYNQIIKGLAKQYNVNYIDLNSPTKDLFKTDGAHYSVDSFHPSASGYKLWEKIIYDNLHQ